jgi:hypothetical protein
MEINFTRELQAVNQIRVIRPFRSSSYYLYIFLLFIAGLLVVSDPTASQNVDTITGDYSYYSYAISTGKIYGQNEGLVASIGFHTNSNFAGKV